MTIKIFIHKTPENFVINLMVPTVKRTVYSTDLIKVRRSKTSRGQDHTSETSRALMDLRIVIGREGIHSSRDRE